MSADPEIICGGCTHHLLEPFQLLCSHGGIGRTRQLRQLELSYGAVFVHDVGVPSHDAGVKQEHFKLYLLPTDLEMLCDVVPVRGHGPAGRWLVRAAQPQVLCIGSVTYLGRDVAAVVMLRMHSQRVVSFRVGLEI